MIGTKEVRILKRVSLRILNFISLLFKDGMVNRRIPLDVILEILSWLPAKSVVRFRCVCKEWCNLIDSPHFTKLHLNKSLEPNSRHNRVLFCTHTLHVFYDIYHPLKWTKLNWPKDLIRHLDTIHVVGSCNGLVCLEGPRWNHGTTTCGPYYEVRCFLICNPTTGTFKSIFPCSDNIWNANSLSYGFGYDSEHDDYKIVVTSSVWTENDDIDVRIYSLKADLWSYPNTSPNRVSSGRRWVNQENVIFKDNTLHYLVSSKIPDDIRSEVSREYRIARFDVVSEKWRDDLYFPIQLKKNFLRIGALDGQLYLHASRAARGPIDVWVLEEDGSWKKMFRLPIDLFWYRPIAGSKDGHNRLLLGDYRSLGDLKWYDQRDNTTMPFKKEQLPYLPKCTSVMLCIASLVKIPGCSSTSLYARS